MRFLRFLPVIVLATACSFGGNQQGTGPAPQTTNIVHPNVLYTDSPAGQYDITTVENKTLYVIPMVSPADSVWHVMPAVFLALNIEPKTVNSAQRYIANTSVTVRHNIGQYPVSKYLNCGNSNVGQTANQAEVTMALTVQVADSGGRASLQIQYEAYAMLDGYAHNRMQCASTGQMEQLIAKLTNEELARGTTH